MKLNNFSREDIFHHVSSIFNYQFDEEFTQHFFDVPSKFNFSFSRKTKKIKHIFFDDILQASYRPRLGTFTLTLEAGNRLIKKLKYLDYQIVVQNEVSSFIKDGKSVFSKHVVEVDSRLGIGMEVFVVNEDFEYLAIGKLALPPKYILKFKNGSAVSVRKGINSLKTNK